MSRQQLWTTGQAGSGAAPGAPPLGAGTLPAAACAQYAPQTAHSLAAHAALLCPPVHQATPSPCSASEETQEVRLVTVRLKLTCPTEDQQQARHLQLMLSYLQRLPQLYVTWRAASSEGIAQQTQAQPVLELVLKAGFSKAFEDD